MKKNLTFTIAEASEMDATLRWVFAAPLRTVFVTRPFPYWVRR